jgi:hypothetical protein
MKRGANAYWKLPDREQNATGPIPKKGKQIAAAVV